MKLLFDFFPIALFFIGFKLFGVFIATAIAMAASLLQVGLFWLKHRKFESLHIITLLLVFILGGLTLLFHNELYIKWKPTILYWVFAIVFFSSQFISNKPIIQRLMEQKISLPPAIWQRLNVSWVIFFGIMGFINLFVIYHFSTNTWVDFKLFGTLLLTLGFIVLQAIYMSKYIDPKNNPLIDNASVKETHNGI